MKAAENKLRTAISRNELYVFLTGQKAEYCFVCPYADMPTDPEQAFDMIKHYALKRNADIWYEFQNALIEMSNDASYIWLELYYILNYIYYRNATLVNYFDLEKVLSTLVIGIRKYEAVLKKDKSWTGAQFKNGQWDNVIRLLRNIDEEFSLNISSKVYSS